MSTTTYQAITEALSQIKAKQLDETYMEIKEQSPADPQRMTGKSRLSRPQMTATKDIPVGGGGGAPVKRVGQSKKDLDNPIPPGSNPTQGFLKALQDSASRGFGFLTPKGAIGLAALSAIVSGEGARRSRSKGSGIQEEAIEENIDMESITKQYGKYAIPAGAAALGFTLAGEKRKRPTFKGFLKNALVAGAAGLGAEALKRQYIANKPDVTSPFLQPAKIPEFKPTGQG